MTAPAPVPDPSQQKLPGLAGIWIGVACIAIGMVVGIVLLVTGVFTLVGGVDDMQRVSVTTGGTVEIDDPGRISVYAERTALGDPAFGFQPSIEVQVTRPDGSVVGLSGTSYSQSYNWNDKEGFLLGRFDADEAGTYRLDAVAGDGNGSYDTLAVGDPFDESGLGGILGGVAVGGLSVLVGIVLIIVSAVRRSRARRERDAAWMATQGGGWGGAYAQPGYPQAGYPQPGYGPPAYGQGYGPPSGQAPGWPPAQGASPPGWAPPPAAPPPPVPTDPTVAQPWTPPPSETEAPEASDDGPTEPIP